MKKARFTEEQIIAILREQEAGAKTVDVCSLRMVFRTRHFTNGRPSTAVWRCQRPGS